MHEYAHSFFVVDFESDALYLLVVLMNTEEKIKIQQKLFLAKFYTDRNELIKLKQNLITITLFRLIFHRTEFHQINRKNMIRSRTH